MTKDIKLLRPREAQDYRYGYANEQGNRFELGIATGRAICRHCGERIRKGERALFGFHDFTGCGSWTAVACWLHLHNCALMEGYVPDNRWPEGEPRLRFEDRLKQLNQKQSNL